jgi:hypothetical protein
MTCSAPVRAAWSAIAFAFVDATFDAAVLEPAARPAVVRMEGKEVGGVTIDFGRLD